MENLIYLRYPRNLRAGARSSQPASAAAADGQRNQIDASPPHTALRGTTSSSGHNIYVCIIHMRSVVRDTHTHTSMQGWGTDGWRNQRRNGGIHPPTRLSVLPPSTNPHPRTHIHTHTNEGHIRQRTHARHSGGCGYPSSLPSRRCTEPYYDDDDSAPAHREEKKSRCSDPRARTHRRRSG